MALRKASASTTRIDLGDEDFIDVRSDISKRDFNDLIAFFPAREVNAESALTPVEATEFTKGLFKALVVGWSLDEPVTVEAYLDLDSVSASLIDEKLAEHFQSIQPDRAEGKAPTT